MVDIDETKLRRLGIIYVWAAIELRPKAPSNKGFMAEKHTGCRSLPEASP